MQHILLLIIPENFFSMFCFTFNDFNVLVAVQYKNICLRTSYLKFYNLLYLKISKKLI